MITVMIVDDHPVLRDGLKRKLEDESDIRVVGEAGDGHELFAVLDKKTPPDVLLLDIHMPNFKIMEALPQLQARYPQMKILIITAYDASTSILQLLDAGVDGYLIKYEEKDVYARAVRRVAAGKMYFSQEVFEVKFDEMETPALSDREKEILILIAHDVTTSEIARRLGISRRTVESHIGRACQKLGVSSRPAAVAKAIQLSYIKPFDEEETS